MKITNVVVSNLEDSLLASGFPFQTEHSPESYDSNKKALSDYIALHWKELGAPEPSSMPAALPDDVSDWCRKRIDVAGRLASCEGGESHDCFLCGISVQMNITAPRYWWPEFQRYHFADIVSSTSTMHRIRSFVERFHGRDFKDTDKIRACFSDRTDWSTIKDFMIYAWNNIDNLEGIKANLPEGWLQTARITTNYRQLKTWERQRSTHVLLEWRDLCAWIHTLPLYEHLTHSRNPRNGVGPVAD